MIQIHRFTGPQFDELVAEFSKQPAVSSLESKQVKYLGAYLADQNLNARWIAVEEGYVDRHYLEEYAGYYGTNFDPPSPKATRMHFFSGDLEELNLPLLLQKAAGGPGKYREVCEALSASYLGYIVIRPLPSAPIGRTILRPYPKGDVGDPPRFFAPASTTHDVHLAGLALAVQGLPFQQQEQAVGACATTAIWSALSRVTRMNGARAPTPLAVTEAANRHVLSDRAFPAVAGLDLSQMLSALDAFGYSPYVLKANPRELNLFKLALKCYLRSGIPVILRVEEDGGEYHAVTVVGYKEYVAGDAAGELKIQYAGGSLTSAGLSRVYLHDDRLGPYARATEVTDKDGTPGLQISGDRDGAEGFNSRLWVHHAIVPHYPKVRLTATDLIQFAGQALPIVRMLAGEKDRAEVTTDLRFVLGQRYLRELFSSELAPSRTAAFVQACRLPRYIGVVRFMVRGSPFVDVLYDTTDIRRDADPWTPILAFVPFREGDAPDLLELIKNLHCPARVA